MISESLITMHSIHGVMQTVWIIHGLEFITSCKACHFLTAWVLKVSEDTHTHNIYPLVVLFMRADSSAHAGPCEGQNDDVLQPRPPPPPPWILLNICCAGIHSSSQDPGRRVVLGHRCHSSISGKYLRRRVRDEGARGLFHHWMRVTSKRLRFLSVLVCISDPKRSLPTSALALLQTIT